MTRFLLCIVVVLIARPVEVQAQQQEQPPADTTARADTVRAAAPTERVVPLEQVVVTATRTAQTLEEVAVPTQVIGAVEIAARGSARLSDLLAEEPGLQLSYDHGAGLQVQGLDAEYTKILVDGEPIIGRTAGTLALDRLTVANVERVEVVRGPSSSLYGSDALAGVVNVITKAPQRPLSAELQTRYGTHQTADVSARLEGGRGPVRGQLFVNRYGSGGYDLSPATAAPTTPAFTDYTGQGRLAVEVGRRTDLSLRARLAAQDQESTAEVQGEEPSLFDRAERRRDWNAAARANHELRPGLRLTATLYGSGYHAETRLTPQRGGAPFSQSRYQQHYGKAEGQVQAVLAERHLLTAGAGFIGEAVDADRVDGARSGGFVFAQDEWQAASWLDLTPSARLDLHSDYATRLSPRLAARADVLPWLDVRASVGSGYKAPAFRQLYLDYTNPQVGYSVFGAEGAPEALEKLDTSGQISAFLLRPEALGGPLQAESSVAFNAGFATKPADWLDVRVNVFHNEISNLIDTQPVALKANGQQVFTYFNLSEVYTRGVEAEATLRPLKALEVGASYTHLRTGDRQMLRDLEAGRIYRRTPAGRDVAVPAGDYGGLVGRSRHRATARLTYRYAPLGLTASARGRYRGRYGFADVNANGIIDTDAEYAPAYAVLDATLTKTLFSEDYALQAGVENLTGHSDRRHTPFLSGRRWFAGLRLHFD